MLFVDFTDSTVMPAGAAGVRAKVSTQQVVLKLEMGPGALVTHVKESFGKLRSSNTLKV